jgi:spermidine synthase
MQIYLLMGSIYAMFFLSGAAALIYQVVWVRSLTLIFGGSHLAVTAVLSIFMAGLAVGGYAVGRLADRTKRPLRLYGLLELGIAAFALVFAGLVEVYPAIYVWLAAGRDGSPLYLTVIRVLFSILALMVPTTLMGGTLPVLSRVVSRGLETLRHSLALLYGLNTLGAVAGAALAGFVFLRVFSVSTTLYIAVGINAFVGFLSIALQEKASSLFEDRERGSGGEEAAATKTPLAAMEERPPQNLSFQLVLWGIGVSGFCALGYEILWTRILTIVIGASVYGFTIMLIAFLTGIALGSKAYGAASGLWGRREIETGRAIAWFGIVQVAIGIAALTVTMLIRDIPANAIRVQGLLGGMGGSAFAGRAWSNLCLAFLYMLAPACFMGVAFPLAGAVHAKYRAGVARAVGEVLASNTVGAILGAALSGFVMIYLFGIERSLQMLSALNVGFGLLVLVSLWGRRWTTAAVAACTLAALAFLALNQTVFRIWDVKYFAIFRNNQPEAFRTPEMVQEAVENTDVLYYAEGVESIVSAIRIKGGEQSFLTNGRVEASSHPQAQQCQFTLGHLPMLLHPDPRKVLVVGLGSGMTLGATIVHPGVGQVTLVELEPKVLGVARTFAKYNHNVLENPKLRIVFNDGRNFLTTTADKFDVITADPIHPWFRGASYLYTSQYFKLAAEHLAPGGVIAQWLPIYELSPRDLQSIVRTFQGQFRHTMLWLTHYDAELVGSNAPLAIDERAMDRRIAEPVIAGDLRTVMMGSAADLLSYYVMGTDGMSRFGRGGILNTDDNLYLEFSAPLSIASRAVMEANVKALAVYRESILPYLTPSAESPVREERRDRWNRQQAAGAVADQALALYLGGKAGSPEFGRLLEELDRAYPWYAPGRFLKAEFQAALALDPRPLQHTTLTFSAEGGGRRIAEIAAVLAPVSKARAAIMFVDNRAQVVYGQLYVDDYEGSDFVGRFVDDVMATIRGVYRHELDVSAGQGGPPQAAVTLRKIQDAIREKIRAAAVQP